MNLCIILYCNVNKTCHTFNLQNLKYEYANPNLHTSDGLDSLKEHTIHSAIDE